MLNKILLSVALFQLSITLIMADMCNVFFSTTRSVTDGPNLVESGICYSFTVSIPGVSSAWIDGIPSGTGSMEFFSGGNCETNTLVNQGSSPVNFTHGGTISSVLVQSCT